MSAHCNRCGFDLNWELECSYCKACDERDELKALVLDMGDVLRDRDCMPRTGDEGTSYCPHCEVLARLDRIGKEQT